MRSKAALAGHPFHPAVVPIPIGAFTVTLIADLLVLAHRPGPWDSTARYALAIGIVFALLAAVLGLIDYFGVTMSAAARRLVNWHLRLNLVGVVLFALSLWLRQRDPARWTTTAFLVSTVAFLGLLVSGWIGGDLAYKHKVGVLENADAEATAIGQREG
jgi:uncharacterized membrane protein